jgi:hypothetical protein
MCKETVVKIFEYTRVMDPNILTLQMPMHECSTDKAKYFINQIRGTSIFFHLGGKQDGKLWSVAKFDPG